MDDNFICINVLRDALGISHVSCSSPLRGDGLGWGTDPSHLGQCVTVLGGEGAAQLGGVDRVVHAVAVLATADALVAVHDTPTLTLRVARGTCYD